MSGRQSAVGRTQEGGPRKHGVLGAVAIFVIRCYQRAVSPIIPPCCRFEPTCSAYAIEAIQRKGLLRGSLKAAWRILRCNPFCEGGYDPVDPPADDAACDRSEGADANAQGATPDDA